MRSTEVLPGADHVSVSEPPPASVVPSVHSRLLDPAWRTVADFLAGLNQMLQLSDFSRGDIFRD